MLMNEKYCICRPHPVNRPTFLATWNLDSGGKESNTTRNAAVTHVIHRFLRQIVLRLLAPVVWFPAKLCWAGVIVSGNQIKETYLNPSDHAVSISYILSESNLKN